MCPNSTSLHPSVLSCIVHAVYSSTIGFCLTYCNSACCLNTPHPPSFHPTIGQIASNLLHQSYLTVNKGGVQSATNPAVCLQFHRSSPAHIIDLHLHIVMKRVKSWFVMYSVWLAIGRRWDFWCFMMRS